MAPHEASTKGMTKRARKATMRVFMVFRSKRGESREQPRSSSPKRGAQIFRAQAETAASGDRQEHVRAGYRSWPHRCRPMPWQPYQGRGRIPWAVRAPRPKGCRVLRGKTRWSSHRMGTACRSQPSNHRGPCQASGAFRDLPGTASTTPPRRALQRRPRREPHRRRAHPGWPKPGPERWARRWLHLHERPPTRSVQRTGGWAGKKMARRTSSLQWSRSVPSYG